MCKSPSASSKPAGSLEHGVCVIATFPDAETHPPRGENSADSGGCGTRQDNSVNKGASRQPGRAAQPRTSLRGYYFPETLVWDLTHLGLNSGSAT